MLGANKSRACAPLVLSAVLACGSEGSDAEGGRASTRSPGASDRADGATAESQPDEQPNAIDGRCEQLKLAVAPQAPEVMIVLDRSASMTSGPVDRWRPSVNAIKALTTELEGTIKFGLTVFPGPGASSGRFDWSTVLRDFDQLLGGTAGAPGGTASTSRGGLCSTGQIGVPPALGVASQLADALDSTRPGGSTPTAATLTMLHDVFTRSSCRDCTLPSRYLLLVTDGQPTCSAGGITTTPEDVRQTTLAIDALAALEIKTYVLGFGIASEPAAAAVMNTFAEHGRTERYLPVEDEASLHDELRRITGTLAPCEFALDDAPSDPSYLRLTIDGESYKFGADWQVEGKRIVLDPEGRACAALRDGEAHDLRITRECTQVQVI